MTVQTAAGAQLKISESSLGGSYDSNMELDADESGADVDTYINVGSITNLGEFGPEFEEITFTELGSRNVLKFKGTRNDGSVELSIGQNLSDEGQEKLWEALQGDDKDDDWAFEVELASGDAFHFAGKVMSFTTDIADPDSVVEGSVTVAIQSGSVQMPEFNTST